MIKFSLISTIFGLLLTVVFTTPLENHEHQEAEDPFECDMRLTEEQSEMLYSPAKNGLVLTKYRWPNKTLPYVLPKNLTTPQKIQTELALKTLESVSCVKFVERTNQADYVEVVLGPSRRGCYSYVGRVNGRQTLGLSNDPVNQGCFRLGAIMHEFLHALGFHHMQCVYDRDDYVTIRWENMKNGTLGNFVKYSNKEVTHFNTTYDYYSVMHYEAYAFSKNKLPTIVPHDESKLKVIGQLTKLSEKDIYKLNAMYECDNNN